jgi:hypothetical protein
MEFKGTSGPWTTKLHPANNKLVVVGPKKDNGKYDIICLQPLMTPDEIGNPNIKLISTSPDLLELAKLVHEICSGKTMPTEKQVAEMKAKAAVVISKALTL